MYPTAGGSQVLGFFDFATGVDIWKLESPEFQLVWTLTPTMRSCVSVSAQECYEELYEEARRGGLLSLFGARFQSWTFPPFAVGRVDCDLWCLSHRNIPMMHALFRFDDALDVEVHSPPKKEVVCTDCETCSCATVLWRSLPLCRSATV